MVPMVLLNERKFQGSIQHKMVAVKYILVSGCFKKSEAQVKDRRPLALTFSSCSEVTLRLLCLLLPKMQNLIRRHCVSLRYLGTQSFLSDPMPCSSSPFLHLRFQFPSTTLALPSIICAIDKGGAYIASLLKQEGISSTAIASFAIGLRHRFYK